MTGLDTVSGAVRALRARLLWGVIALRSAPLAVKPGRIVVVAPHPDDEVFGCGGLIARHRSVGSEVTVVYLTDGGASHRSCCGATPERIGALRLAAAARARAALGDDGAARRRLELRDGAIPAPGAPGFAAAVALLATEFEQIRPTLLLTPCAFDGWPDHEAAAGIVAAAGGRVARCSLLLYPVWMWRNLQLCRAGAVLRHPAVALGIADVRADKRAAIRIFTEDKVPGCAAPSCGNLPSGLLEQFDRAHEIFFRARTR